MTPTPSTGSDARADLLERLKAATGPDRAIDYDIANTKERERIGVDVPLYTSSLDAALALVERVMPGCEIQLSIFSPTHADVELWPVGAANSLSNRQKTTAPLAILVALLSALPADSLGQEETGK